MVTHGDLDSISLRAVARRAGVSPTAVYRHFDDHVDLLHEAVAASWASFIAVLTEAQATSDDPYAQFRAMGDAYVTFAMERPGRYRVLFSNKVDLAGLGAPGDGNGATNGAMGEGAFELLVATVSEMLRAQDDPRDPSFVAVQVHTWIHGIVDLCGSHPEMPWPSTDQLLDGMSEALRLQP